MTVIKMDDGRPRRPSEPVIGVCESYFLTDGETRRHGVPVREALHAGVLTIDDFRHLLANCRDCIVDQPFDGRHDRHGGSTQMPGQCANRSVLDGLRGLV